MNMFNAKSLIFLSVGLICGTMQAMHQTQGYSEKVISKVKILGEPKQIDFQRIYITPITSTGVEASVKQTIEQVPGLTLNGIQDYKLNHSGDILEIDLEKPLVVNISSKNPELEIVIGTKVLKFTEEDIRDEFKKNNTLVIDVQQREIRTTIE